MKTSMAYRTFRSFFNANSENFDLFGNRVHNPNNGRMKADDAFSAALIRTFLIAVSIGAMIALATLL